MSPAARNPHGETQRAIVLILKTRTKGSYSLRITLLASKILHPRGSLLVLHVLRSKSRQEAESRRWDKDDSLLPRG
jgi:hypothetical protein